MKLTVLLCLAFMFTMCNSQKPMLMSGKQGAPLIIYKTNADFSDKIPVAVSKQTKKIVSYPALGDIYLNGKLAKPTKLDNGYWLDNFGVSAHSAYTSYSFDDYAKLEKAPKLDSLTMSIIEYNPIVEIYHCGSRSDFSTIDELNALVKSGFKNCKRK